jgi:hypothetical protein
MRAAARKHVCGEQVFRVELKSGVMLDIYFAHDDRSDLFRVVQPCNWGTLLLCRTGSKEHNIALCRRAAQLGLKWDPHNGVFNGAGDCIAAATEEAVFSALQLEYLPPNRREGCGNAAEMNWSRPDLGPDRPGRGRPGSNASLDRPVASAGTVGGLVGCDKSTPDVEACGKPYPSCCGCAALNSSDCPRMQVVNEPAGAILCRQCAATQGRLSEWDAFHYGANGRCDACNRDELCAKMPARPGRGRPVSNASGQSLATRLVLPWDCPVCGAHGDGTENVEVRYSRLENSEAGIRDLGNVDWKCPACGAWVTPVDEQEHNADCPCQDCRDKYD